MYPDKKNETSERMDEIAEEIVNLASDVPGVDLSRVTRAIERVSEQHKDRIERALRGLADLEQLKKARRGRQFVVAYWHGNNERVAYGIEYPAHKDEQGNLIASRIRMDDYGHPMKTAYLDMEELRKCLTGSQIIHHIAYLEDK